MKNVKFVITDLDNTLLNNKKQISKLNHKAIQQLKENHIFFGLASGRDYESVKTLTKDWHIQDLVDVIIGANGMQIYQMDENILHYQKGISKEIAWKIYETFKDSDGIYLARNGFTRYQESTDADLHADAVKYQEPEKIVNLHEYLKTHDVDKVSIFCQPEQMPKMKKIAQQLKGLPISMMQSSSHLLEFMDKDTNKGSGLKIACDILGIPVKSSMAFGDTTNDYSFIETAGIGVCMINGTDDVKEVADHITKYTNNEDGFYHFIQENVFKKTF